MTFELEHWPNYFGKHTLIRMLKGYVKAYIFFAILFVVCFSLYFYSKNFLGYAIPYTRLGSMVALFGMALGPFLPIISFFQRNRKVPSYGLNKDGFLLNERGWNAAFFTWDEITEVKEFDHPVFGKELHFEFVSFTKALNKKGQDKFEQALRREYEIAKQPKKISGQLVKGDISEFINRFQEYYQAYKEQNSISQLEAFKLASNYNKQYALGYEISIQQSKLLDSIEGLDGKFYSFEIRYFEGSAILVSLKKKEVEGIKANGKIYYPHTIENNLNAEECKEIVRKALGNRIDHYKILSARFAFGGVYEHPHPCWLVRTKNLKATMEGSTMTDYFIDAKTKEIATTITS